MQSGRRLVNGADDQPARGAVQSPPCPCRSPTTGTRPTSCRTTRASSSTSPNTPSAWSTTGHQPPPGLILSLSKGEGLGAPAAPAAPTGGVLRQAQSLPGEGRGRG